MREPTAAGPWSPSWTTDGSPTLVHGGLGQACHSDVGAWTEARQVYAGAAQLRERALAGRLATCRLLDVGTGLGWNLAAAFEALDGTGCALEVVALESDVRVLEAAVELGGDARLATRYPHWRAVVGTLERALAACEPRATAVAGADGARTTVLGEGRGSLHLVLGDARETLAELVAAEPGLRFDAVFLDPFSPSVAPQLWAEEFLARIARHMARGSILATYCAASRVRLGLALGGLRVGRGPGIGNKSESTLASPDLELPPLPARAAANLERALAARWAPGAPPASGIGLECQAD